ncbi:MAG: YkgJ family cysteine cluster protein [Burkholderiaceae bacterium]|nr:YkgJ family cysteine cluster protein [Burkholderiaceae bacterium]
MLCRKGCAACCIAPSITGPIPGMPAPGNKPANTRCVQLDDHNLCKLFGNPSRPAVCASLMASEDMCGTTTTQAMLYLQRLELATTP